MDVQSHTPRIILIIMSLILALQPVTAAPGPQLVTVTPAIIPLSDPELVNPMRGYYRWYGTEAVPQPQPALDHYVRYGWRSLEPARGQYDFAAIEQALQVAQQHGARFSFRVMSVNEFTSPVEVPAYLVSEAGGRYCSYNGQQVWVPNWDSQRFLERAQALMNALSTRFNGDQRLGYYDIGVYGHWGEWVNEGLCTPEASRSTKRALVDMQLAAFSRSRVLMNAGGNEVDAFVYALNSSPQVGIRVDNLCSPFFDYQFTASQAKLALAQERWKTAPIVAEFIAPNPTNLDQCEQQIRLWHIVGLANARLDWSAYTPAQQRQLLDLGIASGYRYAATSVTYPAEQPNNTTLVITSAWVNLLTTPLYERYAIMYELRSVANDQLYWSGTSALQLETLLPAQSAQPVSDSFYLPELVPPGSYTLSLVVRDPTGYRPALQLASQGRDSQGRYPLGTVQITQGTPGQSLFLSSVFR